MLTGRHFAILALTTLTCHGTLLAGPQVAAMTESQRRDALFLDALSVPSPGEVFAALNKACRPNWAALVTPATAPVSTARPQLALAVGVLAANGYIAVQAQDGQQVKNVGREMMAEAKALGVSQSLLARGNSLIEFANSNSWDALADELEATENEVKMTMVEQKDHDLVTLTSAAAWIRGLEIASGVVLANSSLQGSQVLRQPDLAMQLASQLGNLPSRMSRDPLVSRVKEVLESTATLLQQQIPANDKERERIQKLHDDAASLVKLILTSTSVAPPPPAPTPAVTNSVVTTPSPTPVPKPITPTGTGDSSPTLAVPAAPTLPVSPSPLATTNVPAAPKTGGSKP